MTDPQRLLSEHSDADELERSLLGSLRELGPTGAEKAAMWQGMAGKLAVATAAAALTTGVAAQASGAASAATPASQALSAGVLGLSKALAVKVVAAVAVGSLAAAGGALLLSRNDAPKAAIVARVAPVTHALVASVPVPEEPVSAAPEPENEPIASAVPEVRASRGRSVQVMHESRLLAAARAELRDGKVREAAASLARLRTQFPHGVLNQERQVLTIELLAAQGHVRAAHIQARRFVRLHPDTPYGDALSRFLSP
jgi:hypothetical protein